MRCAAKFLDQILDKKLLLSPSLYKDTDEQKQRWRHNPSEARTLNKAQFIERLSKNTNITKNQAESLLDAALEIIQSSVSSGEDVKLVGFGTFDRSARKARSGRNPKTGKTLTIPATCVPRFRPGKEFKDLLKK